MVHLLTVTNTTCAGNYVYIQIALTILNARVDFVISVRLKLNSSKAFVI